MVILWYFLETTSSSLDVFLCSYNRIVLLLLAILLLFICLLNRFIIYEGSKDSVIENADETRRKCSCSTQDEVSEDDTSSRVSVGIQQRTFSAKFKGRRSWMRGARKIYSNFLDVDDQVDGESLSRRRPFRRRHSSVGPMNFARVAKNFISGRGRFKRQISEIAQSTLPKPPDEFFVPSDLPSIPQNLKPEEFYISLTLNELELPEGMLKIKESNITTKHYLKDDFILQPDDSADSIIAVLEGSIGVYIIHNEKKSYLVRRIEKGDCFFGFLSLLETLMEVDCKLRNVSVRAITDCTIARYETEQLRKLFLNDPRGWVRPIQIIMVRLLHVTMTTLHKYFGLTGELMKKRLEEKPERIRHEISAISSPQPQKFSSNNLKDSCHISLARRWFAEALKLNENLEAVNFLNQCVQLESIPADYVIQKEGADGDRLIMVYDGVLKFTQKALDEEDDEIWHSFVYQREIFGGLHLVTNEISFYSLKSHTSAVIAYINKADFSRLVEIRPEVMLPVGYSVVRRLSTFLRSVDFAVNWMLLDSGQPVYKKGDAADCMFVVISGRLRSVVQKVIVEEFGRGDVIGMIEVFQRVPRPTTVLAVRYSQLACVPEGLLTYIKLKFPQIGFRLVYLLGQYYTATINKPLILSNGLSSAVGDPKSHIKNLHTIAVISASSDIPLVAFTCELYHALSHHLRVQRLSSRNVSKILGNSVLQKDADFRLMHWLNLQEDLYPVVIYECDDSPTIWTSRCLRQADAILLVARGEQRPQNLAMVDEAHLRIGQDGIRTNKELILLWDETVKSPRGTVEWLKESYFSGHHHIRAGERLFQWSNKNNMEQEILEYYEKNIFGSKVESRSDFSRLARILTGNAIGVVLGGGGARGASHIGVLEALDEAGIPIDMIGGTSIGSLIAGVYAESQLDVEKRCKNWFMSMCSLWSQLWDLTYTYSALFTGAGFNKTLKTVFSDKQIEDLWIPYFCITTDISSSEMRVHCNGPLWTYVRASMSLAGYLPPLCDPADGHLLLDGGYVNNLPADVMRSVGARIVIAVDVGAPTESDLLNYGDTLSGFQILFKKLNPFGEPVKVLNMEEIQSRLAYVSCVRQLEQVKRAPYCCYVRPAIENFKTLEFSKFSEIKAIGYEKGKKAMQQLVSASELIRKVAKPEILVEFVTQDNTQNLFSFDTLNNNISSSFTNLAAEMSKIPKVESKSSSNCDDLSDSEIDQNKVCKFHLNDADLSKTDERHNVQDGYMSDPSFDSIKSESFERLDSPEKSSFRHSPQTLQRVRTANTLNGNSTEQSKSNNLFKE